MSRPRRYKSPGRAESARETRHRIVSSAQRLLLSDGYQAMSMSALARAAGVSPQTIYNTIGGKAAVVKAAYDVLLAGDEEPIAMNERPEFRAVLAQRSTAATLRAYATLSRLIAARIGELVGVLLAEGAGSDAELREFLATIDGERRIGNSGVVRHITERFGLPDGLSEQRAVDHVWTVTGPEVLERLVRRCGWSLDEYETWLAVALKAGFASR